MDTQSSLIGLIVSAKLYLKTTLATKIEEEIIVYK
jgi:hypothetical protein